MRIKIKDFEIYIEYLVIIVVFLCVIPFIRNYLKCYYMCFLFITFHELSHMFMASVFGVKIKRIAIRICGLNIVLENMQILNICQILIYLAGPIANIVLAILFKKIPFVFYMNFSLAIINLIPIRPLDGYNILCLLLNNCKNKEEVLLITEKILFCLLTFIGIIQLIFLKNISIILMCLYIYLQIKKHENIDNKDIYQKCYKNVTKFYKNY